MYLVEKMKKWKIKISFLWLKNENMKNIIFFYKFTLIFLLNKINK